MNERNSSKSLCYVVRVHYVTDEEDSGEDEDIMTRTTLKRQSQQIIDQKTKRKAFRKKKTKK